MRKSSLPLDGIVVADFSRVLAGPLCTMMLADQGARVIKVEEPGRGDETRRWGPPFAGTESAYFLSVNRNKESVTLNLKSPEGKRLAEELIRRADVVVDNFRAGQRKRLGLHAVARLNPEAVHCSIVGFESGSRDAELPGYDLLAQALGGLMAITGEAAGTPMKAGVALSDVLTAHYAFGAITGALVGKERGGSGATMEVSLLGSTIASLVNVAQSVLVTGREAKRYGNAHPSLVPYELYESLDKPFVLGVGTDRQFRQLCSGVIGAPALAEDRRYGTNDARVRNRSTLVPILAEVFRTRPRRHWLRLCAKFDIPAAAVQGVKEALESDSGRRMVVEIEHPEAGVYRAVRSPVLRGGKAAPIRRAPPLLGQDTDVVLRWLGKTRQEIAELRAAGAV